MSNIQWANTIYVCIYIYDIYIIYNIGVISYTVTMVTFTSCQQWDPPSVLKHGWEIPELAMEVSSQENHLSMGGFPLSRLIAGRFQWFQWLLMWILYDKHVGHISVNIARNS